MYFGYPPYESVAEKQKKAEKLTEKLRKKGMVVNPIVAFKGKMAATFWGKSWCTNLESYADYENRLGRGRSYVRSGCVCHLEIKNGVVEALVSGTKLYSVTVNIASLAKVRWDKVRAACAGEIGSLLELLQGKLSKKVMERVCDAATGIFPSPKEITFNCSCPDWASMCKHVAAALYAIGRQLDAKPELLFVLRGVDAADLITSGLDFSQGKDTDTIHTDSLSVLFDIDLDVDSRNLPAPLAPAPTASTPSKVIPPKSKTNNAPKPPEKTAPQKATPEKTTPKKKSRKKKPTAKEPVKIAIKAPFNPARPTGAAIRKLRLLAKLRSDAFARALGISPVTLQRWEESKGILTLRNTSKDSLTTFQDTLLRTLH